MARLSRVFSRKGRKSNSNEKSALMQRMTSRTINHSPNDERLLGDLFITVEEQEIVDRTNKHIPIPNRLKTTSKITHMESSGSLNFDGRDTNLNIEDGGNFNFGLDDFSIDWWEYQRPDPEGGGLDISPTQYSIYKNSIDRKSPFQIVNGPNKLLYISSNGDNWDITDGKHMGAVEPDEWIHWAITRSNNNFYTFKNGVIKNIWESEEPINNSDGYLTFGSSPKGNNFYGYMDKIRVIKGTTLWTDEFKPTKEDLFY